MLKGCELNPAAMAKGGLVSSIVITLALLNCWLIYFSFLPHGDRSGNVTENPFSTAAAAADLVADFGSRGRIDISPAPGVAREPLRKIDSALAVAGECDISAGKWVPDARPPLYTNETCKYIQPSQNCMMNGRPDRGYLEWRWQPDGCELEYLDPAQFLKFMKGKKMVFIGDSIARNHMQSLLCALAQIEEPEKLFFDTKDKEMKWGFRSYNFTLANLWSPFLVQHEFIDEIYHVHLDVPDEVWNSQLSEYDVAIMSSGYWYFRPTLYYMNKTIIGCNPRSGLNYTTFEVLPAYRVAHRHMLKHMLEGYKGITLLRTVTVDHFEYGSWNTGGLCNRTTPFSKSEAPEMPWMSNEMNTIQVEEFETAAKNGNSNGRLYLLNVTYSALMRPDGHPNTYRVQPPNERPQNDCLHWCLPGPIDMWNQLVWYTLRKSGLRSRRGSRSTQRLKQFHRLKHSVSQNQRSTTGH